jgi:hypothetical protein
MPSTFAYHRKGTPHAIYNRDFIYRQHKIMSRKFLEKTPYEKYGKLPDTSIRTLTLQPDMTAGIKKFDRLQQLKAVSPV